MIKKNVKVELTKEEIESTEPIQIILEVYEVGNKENEGVTYTINYPKGEDEEVEVEDEEVEVEMDEKDLMICAVIKTIHSAHVSDSDNVKLYEIYLPKCSIRVYKKQKSYTEVIESRKESWFWPRTSKTEIIWLDGYDYFIQYNADERIIISEEDFEVIEKAYINNKRAGKLNILTNICKDVK